MSTDPERSAAAGSLSGDVGSAPPIRLFPEFPDIREFTGKSQHFRSNYTFSAGIKIHVAIDGNVYGLGSVKHREFAFASGEMSEAQFTAFLGRICHVWAACDSFGPVVQKETHGLFHCVDCQQIIKR